MAANYSSVLINNVVGLFNELKTVESERSYGFDSPLFLSFIIILYLLFVYKIGPSIMQNRQPYRLKWFISAYNLFQVISCLHIINQIWILTGWDIFNFRKCVYYEPKTLGRKIFDDLTYFTFWLKITEFTDTVVFVLRKKYNQISYLHVFHHTTTLTLMFLLLRYNRGNGGLYPIFVNSGVHVIMYSYYLLSNVCGQEFMRRLIYVKKSITIIQMTQFVFIIAQSTIMWKSCKVPDILRIYYCFVVGVFFYGFYDFYKKAYLQRQRSKVNAKQS